MIELAGGGEYTLGLNPPSLAHTTWQGFGRRPKLHQRGGAIYKGYKAFYLLAQNILVKKYSPHPQDLRPTNRALLCPTPFPHMANHRSTEFSDCVPR
eukprot:442657-Hanusia_phi.AAC.1